MFRVVLPRLLDFLRTHGFKTYTTSGGGIEFMRPMTEKMYGIPPEQVIGSSIVTKYLVKNDKPYLMREPKVNFVDDGPGKPVGEAPQRGWVLVDMKKDWAKIYANEK